MTWTSVVHAVEAQGLWFLPMDLDMHVAPLAVATEHLTLPHWCASNEPH